MTINCDNCTKLIELQAKVTKRNKHIALLRAELEKKTKQTER